MKLTGETEEINDELVEIEEKIAKEIAEENRNKVIDAFKSMTDTDGTANVNGLWSQKRKLFPKNMKQLPVAKKDVNNRIIS